MRMLRLMLPLLFAAMAFQGTARADEALSAAEVKQILTGHTALGTTSRGSPYWLYRRADGTQSVETGSGFSDEGEWSVKDDGALCSVWEKIRDGEEHCTKIYRTGENRYYAIRTDDSKSVFKMLKGNPENL